MINPFAIKAIIGSIGLAGTATTVYFVLPKSSNSIETEIEINSRCVNSGKSYDECIREAIPDSEETKKDREEQEAKAKLERATKTGITRDAYEEKEKSCGTKNFADQTYTNCVEKISKEYYVL